MYYSHLSGRCALNATNSMWVGGCSRFAYCHNLSRASVQKARTIGPKVIFRNSRILGGFDRVTTCASILAVIHFSKLSTVDEWHRWDGETIAITLESTQKCASPIISELRVYGPNLLIVHSSLSALSRS